MTVAPKLRFLAACSYLPASVQGVAQQKLQLEEGVRSGLSPEVIWAGIQRHRIFALAERVLRQHKMTALLGDFQPALQARARQAQFQSLRLMTAFIRVAKALSSAGLEHHFVKGPLLSQKIYGDAGLRHSKDLDLVVRREQIPTALEALQADGWQLRDGSMWLKDGMYRRLAERRLRHLLLVHPQDKVGLELHWRIEAAHCPEMEEQWRRLWSQESSQLTQVEALHLCLHGATHSWSRLKWLGDVAAIVDREPGLWDASQETLRALGLELVAAQTILLLQQLCGVQPDEMAARIVKSHPQARALAEFALQEMIDGDVYRRRSVKERWTQQRYFAAIEARYSRRTRFLYRLSYWSFEDSKALYSHPVLLLGMPVARAASLLQRYVLSGER